MPFKERTGHPNRVSDRRKQYEENLFYSVWKSRVYCIQYFSNSLPGEFFPMHECF